MCLLRLLSQLLMCAWKEIARFWSWHLHIDVTASVTTADERERSFFESQSRDLLS
jgi:hypothetical protein